MPDTTEETTPKNSCVSPKRRALGLAMDALALVCVVVLLSSFVTYAAGGMDRSKMSVFGYRLVYVLSDSMEPTIMTHALCAIRITDDAEVGDIIVYKYELDDGGSMNIIHRIVSEEDGEYTTKGDNNASVDPEPVSEDQIIGRVVWCWNGFADIVS